MARRRFDGLRGVLGSPLTDVATTVTFAQKLTFLGGDVPTIADPDYLPLSILAGDGSLAEVVHLTAYTKGATTGAVVRAREGTVGVTHSAGAATVWGSTAFDFTEPTNLLDDIAKFNARFGSTVIYDYEFDATSASLPAGWSWYNQGAATYSEGGGYATVTFPPSAARTVRGIFRTPPTEAAWELVAKVTWFGPCDNFNSVAVALGQSSDDKSYMFLGNDARGFKGFTFTGSTYNGEIGQTLLPFPHAGLPLYLRLTKESATVYQTYVSRDGADWHSCHTMLNPTAHLSGTIDRIGFTMFSETSSGVDRSFRLHWMRVRG